MPSVVDTTTGIVYFGTGNPSPDLDNSQRPGCDPWVNATVALDAKTGKFLWAHSEFCNDQWDYDSHQAPMIFNLTLKNGQTVRAVGHGNKSSYYFIYNAKTGAVIAQTPPLMPGYNKHVPPTLKGTLACPTASGGIEYSPPAFSPLTQYTYEPGLSTCAIFKLAPRSQTNLHAQGAPDFGGVPVPYGKSTGFMAAVDDTTGKIAWRVQVSQPMVGGALATAGNLVFTGCDDGNFYAFNAQTGKVLWKANLGLDFGAAPLTYEVNGVQYIAIADGGSVVSTGKTGGTLVVFKLNGAPIHKVPAVVPTTAEGVSAAISTKGLTQINPYMWIDAAKQHVVIKLVAAMNSQNSGFNFDGYFKGQANFIVPGGWAVDWIFSNSAALPHSAALASSLKAGAPLPGFTFGAPVETPDATAGTKNGVTQYVGFPANQPGKFYLICAVPGHVEAGMWDYFTISTTAKAPSIQTS
jgi:outer membrane protein assembly factor BamB